MFRYDKLIYQQAVIQKKDDLNKCKLNTNIDIYIILFV